ncbi:MAG: alpha/beta hydrolase [Myxococcota bacterium]
MTATSSSSNRLRYEFRGEGSQPVALLHGFMGSGRNLSSLARRWADRQSELRILIPDLTGHGGSPSLPEPPQLEDLARDLIALLLATFGSKPAKLVGHSMGGRVALLARILAPERVSAVTLIDIGPSPMDRPAGELDPVVSALVSAPSSGPSRDVFRRHFSEAGIGTALTDWLLMNLARTDSGELAWRIDRSALGRLEVNSRDLDLWPAVAMGPTVCVRGGRSPFVGDTDAGRLEAEGVEVHTIPKAGHFVHVDAQPELVDVLCGASTAA